MENSQNKPSRNTLKRRLLNLAGGLPYGLVSHLLYLFFGNPLLQRTLFRSRRRLLIRIRSLIGGSGNLARDLTRHMLSRYAVPWQVNALSRCDETSFRKWVHLENETLLDELKAAGRPILLVNCHTGMSRLVPLMAVRLGHDLATLEPEAYLQLMGARSIEKIQFITLRGQGEKFWMKEMFKAKKVLDAKGIVHLALDGHQGTGGVPHDFLGRERIFHVSMAQLAIQMDAAIVLVTSVLDGAAGHVRVCFRGPLDVGDASMPAEARLGMFLDPYVASIEAIWRTDLGNIAARHLPPYLRSAPITKPFAQTIVPVQAQGNAR